MDFIISQVNKHPDKYEIGVIAMAEKQARNIIVMNGNTQEQQMSRVDMDNLSQDDILALRGKVMYELKSIIVPVFTIVLKKEPVPDNLIKKEGKPTEQPKTKLK